MSEETEIQELIKLARKYMWADEGARRKLEAARVFLSRNDFYSEYPTLSEVDASFEYRSDDMKDAQLAVFYDAEIFDEARLTKNANEISALAAGFQAAVEAESGFFWKNTQFSSLDALTYYGMIRKLKPRRLIEIGSGYSTFVAQQAIQDGDINCEMICIDPDPRADISVLKNIKFHRQIIQNIDFDEFFATTGENDIVFYDGSHTIKTGSDTVFFYLKILPYLPAGVFVHAHDVRIPWARNVKALTEAKLSWGEQYVLLAHLHNTKRYKVEFGSNWLASSFAELADLIMKKRYPAYGGSLWFSINSDEQ